MSSTHTALYYHIIFATHMRIPHIHTSWRPRLHSYLAGIIKNLDAHVIAVGGVDDHVHLLIGLKPSQTLMDIIRQIKTRSSKWVHAELQLPAFAWQDGYAAFTVSPSALPEVQQYIDSQETHHQRMSFKDELLKYLEKSGVKYDPKYLEL